MTMEPETPATTEAEPGPAGTPAAADATKPATDPGKPALGSGTWVILPTYNEADNLPGISAAILDSLPGAVLLVVDDGSPDGTGDLADGLAAADPRVRVKHRAAKQGLGRAYLDGFGEALRGGATTIVQMDADWSHDPKALPSLIAADRRREGRPRDRLALHEGRRRPGLGHGAADHLPRRIDVRPDRAQPQAARPHRRVQGVARHDARSRAVRRRPRGRLRVPDRDDLPRLAARRPRGRGPDHVPRSARRPVEDEPPDRRRGARRRREPALGRAARPRTGAARARDPGRATGLATRDEPRGRLRTRRRPGAARRSSGRPRGHRPAAAAGRRSVRR